MKFTKMHGIGNDFIIIDGFHQPLTDRLDLLARRLTDRRFSIGGDGLILALPSDCADARMRIFNSDGGEPEMCGNGIRCLGKFIYDNGICRKNPMKIETLAGVKTLVLDLLDGQVSRVTVDMGTPCVVPSEIPVASESNIIHLPLDGREISFFCVSMGNPHAVTYDIFPDKPDFSRLGAFLESHPIFPHRSNIEFCRVNPDGGVDVRVWERGAGETLGCGTGACAALVAGATLGLIPRTAVVHLPGGDLDIRWTPDHHLFMTGPATVSFLGEVDCGAVLR